jgi:hypothetical protein
MSIASSPVFIFDPNKVRTGPILEGLEAELVQAIYKQRSHEEEILQFFPENTAPQSLVDDFTKAKLIVQRIENRIRRIRHGF